MTRKPHIALRRDCPVGNVYVLPGPVVTAHPINRRLAFTVARELVDGTDAMRAMQKILPSW